MLDLFSHLKTCLMTDTCVYNPFVLSLGMAFLLSAVGTFGFLFSISLRRILFFHALLTAGILMNFANGSLFSSDTNGMVLAGFVLLTVFCEITVELAFLNRKPKATQSRLFYALPFGSFILMAISRDLLTLFVALEGFQLIFFILFFMKVKDREALLILIKEGMLSLAAFAWGLSILYAISGNVSLSGVQKMLAQSSQADPILLSAVLLMGLGIAIKLRLFFLSIHKIKKHA